MRGLEVSELGVAKSLVRERVADRSFVPRSTDIVTFLVKGLSGAGFVGGVCVHEWITLAGFSFNFRLHGTKLRF